MAKAEAAVVGGHVARAAGLIGVAIGVILFALGLFVIGTSLFLAEWLFGSMGWGVLHGVLLFAAIATAAILSVVEVSPQRIARSGMVALLLGVAVAIVLGLKIPNQLYTLIGDNTLTSVEPGVRPLVVGMLVWAAIGLLLGIALVLQGRGSSTPAAADGVAATDTGSGGSAGSRFAMLVGAVLVGAAIGAFTAITFSAQVGIALGITAWYAGWIVLMGIDVSRTGVDAEAIKARYTPTTTIETSKETLEWLKTRMPPGIGS